LSKRWFKWQFVQGVEKKLLEQTTFQPATEQIKMVTSEIMRHLGYDVCDDVLGHVSANLLAIVINYVSVIKGDE
jgi:hypothetical protein